MKNAAPILVIALSLSCNQQSDSGSQAIAPQQKRAIRAEHDQITEQQNLLKVQLGTALITDESEEEHLYGRFLNDRAEFYIMQPQGMFVADEWVDRLTLYYLDGKLCKKKYEFSSDISQELIRSYGSFKFRPLNEKNLLMSESEKVLAPSKTGTAINEKFDLYQLRWVQGESTLKYEFSKDSSSVHASLIYELPNYSQMYKRAEKNLTIAGL